MPLVAHSDLPVYERLKAEGMPVLESGRALHQDIRELHIGILNMMQDKALEATERQFVRLLGNSSQIMQVYVHLFNIDGIERGPEARAHIDKYYKSFEQIKKEGLDALILTGTNLTDPDITKAPFWPQFCEVLEWAQSNVTSVLCSCLATHAVVKYLYNIDRVRLPEKLWGVFEHSQTLPSHPLLQSVNTRFFVPHSRYNNIPEDRLRDAGALLLVGSEQAGMHMATSADGLRFVFFQGHPEYDTQSLLKEYKREALRFNSGERESYPVFPIGYLSLQNCAILDEFKQNLLSGKMSIDDFPETLIQSHLENIWRDSSKSILNNWIGCVYQTTNMDRTKQFMDGIDPSNPLNITT